MIINIDTRERITDADKAALAALIGATLPGAVDFPSQSERITAAERARDKAMDAEMDRETAAGETGSAWDPATRKEGTGRSIQAEVKARKASAQQTATDDSSDEGDDAEGSTEPVDLRARVTEVAEALVAEGRSKDISKVLTSLGVRLVRRLKDHQLEEALAKLEALTEGTGRPAKPDLPEDDDTDDDEPADDDPEDDDDSDPLDDVSAEDDDDDEADKALLEKAFNRARQLLDAGKRSKVVAALKEVGARKVTELTVEQVPGFLKQLKGE